MRCEAFVAGITHGCDLHLAHDPSGERPFASLILGFSLDRSGAEPDHNAISALRWIAEQGLRAGRLSVAPVTSP